MTSQRSLLHDPEDREAALDSGSLPVFTVVSEVVEWAGEEKEFPGKFKKKILLLLIS